MTKTKKKRKIKQVEKQCECDGNTVQNCTFYGVKWDEPALEIMKVVAVGLTNLTELFKSQNVTIESLLKINPDKK